MAHDEPDHPGERRQAGVEALRQLLGGKAVVIVPGGEADRGLILVRDGEEPLTLTPRDDPRAIDCARPIDTPGPDECCYVRVRTEKGGLAWSSPVLGDEIAARGRYARDSSSTG